MIRSSTMSSRRPADQALRHSAGGRRFACSCAATRPPRSTAPISAWTADGPPHEPPMHLYALLAAMIFWWLQCHSSAGDDDSDWTNDWRSVARPRRDRLRDWRGAFGDGVAPRAGGHSPTSRGGEAPWPAPAWWPSQWRIFVPHQQAWRQAKAARLCRLSPPFAAALRPTAICSGWPKSADRSAWSD